MEICSAHVARLGKIFGERSSVCILIRNARTDQVEPVSLIPERERGRKRKIPTDRSIKLATRAKKERDDDRLISYKIYARSITLFAQSSENIFTKERRGNHSYSHPRVENNDGSSKIQRFPTLQFPRMRLRNSPSSGVSWNKARQWIQRYRMFSG